MFEVPVKTGPETQDYEAYASLLPTVRDYRSHARANIGKLGERTIWMVNSTAQGGGVAEMLPGQMRLLRELGLKVKWLVLETDDQHFFDLTKRIHNLIHGKGDPTFTAEDKGVYEQVNRTNAERALDRIKDDDIVVVHDPQPAGLAQFIKEKRNVKMVWRCHIGLDEVTDATKGAWDFLAPYLEPYDHFVFTAPEYIPEGFSGNVSIIPPAIDPLSHKNRYLSVHKTMGILHCSGLIPDGQPFIYDFYNHMVRRIQPDGSTGSPNEPAELNLLMRPIISQVSRWDNLKGFVPLMKGFIEMKNKGGHRDLVHARRVELSGLVLAGPDPDFVKDDPEGIKVLEEIKKEYTKLPFDIAKDIAILLLPMESAKENALIVNAIQRSSTIICQNSIQEGFGLTATEGMWKKVPVMVSNACGLRHQVRDGIEGRIVQEASDPSLIALTLDDMLSKPKKRELWGFNAQNRAIDRFVIFKQLSMWIDLYHQLVSRN